MPGRQTAWMKHLFWLCEGFEAIWLQGRYSLTLKLIEFSGVE